MEVKFSQNSSEVLNHLLILYGWRSPTLHQKNIQLSDKKAPSDARRQQCPQNLQMCQKYSTSCSVWKWICKEGRNPRHDSSRSQSPSKIINAQWMSSPGMHGNCKPKMNLVVTVNKSDRKLGISEIQMTSVVFSYYSEELSSLHIWIISFRRVKLADIELVFLHWIDCYLKIG